jgi:hypothetical protein
MATEPAANDALANVEANRNAASKPNVFPVSLRARRTRTARPKESPLSTTQWGKDSG